MHTIFKFKLFFARYRSVVAHPTRTSCLNFAVFFMVIVLMSNGMQIFAQESVPETINDSIKVHSAKKATIMSLALPGLGQAYNKKYWKIPIIYAGFGVLFYSISKNGAEYRNFRTAYNIVATGDSANFNNEYVERYNADLNQLQEGRNYYRRNLELSYVLTGLLYILQVVDASVDANLYGFDVSDNLSLRFEPISDQYMTAWRPAPAIKIRFRF